MTMLCVGGRPANSSFEGDVKKRIPFPLIPSLFLFLFCLLPNDHLLYSQTADPLSFFPHHLGDIWQRGLNRQNIITKDSLGADGRYYIEMSIDGRLRLDTSTFELHGREWGGEEYSNLLFKLDAQQGAHWAVRRYPNATILATVVFVFNAFVVDTVVEVKQVDYADSASSLLILTKYFASSFGLAGEDIDAMPDWRLLGARINGVQHGYVVSVPEARAEVPSQSFALHQNYPNPFNPSTSIEYILNEGAQVELKVIDILGRDVKLLVNSYQSKGTYKIPFDGAGLASGVYMYVLSIPHETKMRRMLLLR
jgi:hypothetical protein